MTTKACIRWTLLSCVGTGAIPGLIEFVFGGMSLENFVWSALSGFVYASCIMIPCTLAIPKLLVVLEGRSQQARVAWVTGMLAGFCVTGWMAASLILWAFGLTGPGDLWWTLRICLLITFTFGAFSFLIASLQSRLETAREALHIRELAEERERKIAAEARFASLESRIHPHFLFNTLNSISALVREDPAEAERMIERLSALLRFSLDSEVAGVVTLREELRIVRDYLEIEKVRFGARLRYRVEAAQEANEQLIPALSVQTLVENSVKYAVGARGEGAEIVVSASVEDGVLRVEVSDDGPGFARETTFKAGHGLDLLERRLTSLFGASASLEMTAGGGRTHVAISVAA